MLILLFNCVTISYYGMGDYMTIAKSNNKSVTKKFVRYVSQNVLGMIGMSLYILADTFFISESVGANGITALNIVLPIYSFIFAIGAMIGVGSAIRFSINKNKGSKSKTNYFFNALFWGTTIGLIFSLIGLFFPGQVVSIMGGDSTIVEVGRGYTMIFMSFAPFFIWNHIFNAFVLNDGSPSIAMSATLFSSLFNIIFDYVLMFPLNMGMEGAALATALSPIVGVMICFIHIFSKKNTTSLKPQKPSFKKLVYSCQVGISSFVGQISSGVITIVFNFLILGLTGNTGVAAYGIVANVSLVGISVFNGVSQGSQPLFSEHYGKGDKDGIKILRRLSIITSLLLSAIMILLIFVFTDFIVGMFNSENNLLLEKYAVVGLRLYSIGFIFAGLNVVGSGIFSATNFPKWAFATSIARGFVLIILSAVVMSILFGMTGVWLDFAVAELLTLIITSIGFTKITKF